MSSEEQLASIGRTVTEYGEAKKELSLLTGELSRISYRLAALGDGLKQLPYRQDPHISLLINDIPAKEELHKMVNAVINAYDRKRELADNLKQCGAEMKD
jgi:hypothetical protein